MEILEHCPHIPTSHQQAQLNIMTTPFTPEDIIRHTGLTLFDTPIEVDNPLQWYGVRYGRIVGLFKRSWVPFQLCAIARLTVNREDAVFVTERYPGFSMLRRPTFDEAAQFVYGPEWRGNAVFVYWGPEGGE